MQNPEFKLGGLFWLPLLTLAFFLSGFFVVLTPLPIFFLLIWRPKRAWFELILPCFLFLVFLYGYGVPQLYPHIKETPLLALLIMPPGMNFLDWLNPTHVSAFGLSYFAFFVGIALVLKKVFEGGRLAPVMLARGMLILFLAGLTIYGLYSVQQGVPPTQFIHEYFTRIADEFLSLQQESPATASQIAFLREHIPLLVSISVMLFPGFLFASMVAVLVLNLVIGQKLVVFLAPQLPPVELRIWFLPFALVWTVIVALSALLANTQINLPIWAVAISGNLLLATMSLYFFQGLAIISFFLAKWEFRVFSRISIYFFFILFFQFFFLFIVSLGFFDSWFEFRKPKSKDHA